VTVRKPFDIGDRVHISSPNIDTSADGCATWYVENMTLFYTTFRFASTNEVCTIANGDLANMRIVNGARSPKASVCIRLKFGVDTPYELIQSFKSAVEEFVKVRLGSIDLTCLNRIDRNTNSYFFSFSKARPREWVRLFAIRATIVQSDLGYVEYAIALQHRESWQNVGSILASKAELASFCLEVSKKLDMRYVAPAVPVHLEIEGRKKTLLQTVAELDSGEEDAQLLNPSTGAQIHALPTHKSESNLDRSSLAVKAANAMFKKPKQGKK